MSQRITTRIILDVHRPYFPGELILGKIMLASPSTFTPHAIRLIWAGGVTIRPTLQDHESHIYFRHSYALSNDKLNGKKIRTGVAYESSAFVENGDTTKPLDLTLEESVTYSFAFGVRVPSDIPLPSSTEDESSMVGGKIVYTIESCIDFMKDDAAPARSHILVTVLEHMDVRLPELAMPRSEETVCSLWLPHTPLASPCNYRTAMRVTLPCQASTRGGHAEIVIHVWHSMEYQRLKGVKVSLLRLRQVHFNGSVYAFPEETVIAMRADVDLKEEKDFVQTLRCRLPIRDDLTPSISDSAKLMEISYKLQIKVQLQEGTYQSLDGERKGYMAVELPFLIGTVPLMINNNRRPSTSPRSPVISVNTNSNNKKINDTTSDSDVGSTLSAELENSSPTEKILPRKKSKGGLKIGTLRFGIIGKKPKTPKGSPTTTPTITTSAAPDINIPSDNESTFSHSHTSSSKNTDQDAQYSAIDDSNTSHSAPSPTITESKPPNKVQTQQITSLELRNLRQTNTYHEYSPDEKITTSNYESKPDEKDDPYLDTERMANINKDKADAIAKASIVSPIDGTRLLPPRMDSLTISGSENKFVKDDSLSDNGDLQQQPTEDGNISKESHRIQYHDIFASSGEEDSDDDNNTKENKFILTGNTIRNDDDTTMNNNDGSGDRQQQQMNDTVPPLPQLHHLPSPPMDQTECKKLHEYDSDSSGNDDSPVAMMSRQFRRR